MRQVYESCSRGSSTELDASWLERQPSMPDLNISLKEKLMRHRQMKLAAGQGLASVSKNELRQIS